MSPIAVLVSAVIGILVMIQSRKWFFGSDEDFWKGSAVNLTRKFFQEVIEIIKSI